MPDDLDILHVAAVALLITAWATYSPLLTRFARGTLNTQLSVVRRRWIDLSTRRDNRTFDAVMLGHVINSVAFFGSATLLVLAGVVGVFANAGRVHVLVSTLPFVGKMSLELFALKVLVVGMLLTISFFSFTYALRKFVYTVSLLGGLPEPGDNHPHQAELIAAAATVLSEAVRSFNSGIRGYYYSVSALFLFISPVSCMATTGLVMLMLFYRQTSTNTARTIEAYVDALQSGDKR
ncbi:MAG: DUF599 domain-containing protein [Aestuariivirgaceae bacterium]